MFLPGRQAFREGTGDIDEETVTVLVKLRFEH